MMKMSVKFYQNTMFAVLLAALHMGCTASQPQSKVTIQLPVLSKQVSTLEFEDTDNLEGTWRGTTTSADQINCYWVMIGGESDDLKRNQCYKRDSEDAVAIQFGEFIGGVVSGKTVDLELPADVPRRMILLGMNAQDGTCRDFTKDGPEEGMLSFPRVLYDKIHSFKSGSQALQMKIPTDLTGLAQIDDCDIDGEPDSEEPDDDDRVLPGSLEVAGDIVNQFLGHTIASAENMVIVGAPGTNSGSVSGDVYIYTWDEVEWVKESLRLPLELSSDTNAEFGYSVDTDGESIIVGAPGAGLGATILDRSGKAYIYRKDPATGSWAGRLPTLTITGEAGERLGLSVAIRGNLAAAGAPDNLAGGKGRIKYVKRINGSWATSPVQALAPGDLASLPDNLKNNDDKGFGYSLSISPNERFLAVGAPFFESVDKRADEGAVFVLEFDRDANRITEHLVQPDPSIKDEVASNLNLGRNVKISNTTLASGNHLYDRSTDSDNGSVLVSRINNKAWKDSASFLKVMGVPADYSEAGAGLAVLGDLLVVGFRQTSSVAGKQDCGYFNLYKFDTVTAEWAQQGESQPPNICQNVSKFAGALTINKGFIGVGAPQANDGSNVGQGSISIFPAQ